MKKLKQPSDDQVGLKMLPEEVRNTMGYLENGGTVKKYKKSGKVKKKGRGYASLDAAEKEVYKRGLAAYMSSGNRPKVSQHAWAMARVRSAFGRKEAAKIRAGKGKKKKK